MNVIEFKKMIDVFLLTKADRVFDGWAPPNTQYPFVTYTLSNSYTDENMVMERFYLIIDVWDNKPLDTTALETLVGTIDGDGHITAATGLHRKHYYVSGTLAADTYRESRNDIEDEDYNIRRRQLRYEVLVYLS
jgi:hypothetical protein